MKKHSFITGFLISLFFLFALFTTSAASNRPLIGISGNIQESKNFPGYSYSYVGNTYVKAVIASGGTPMILPVTENMQVVSQLMEHIDGLILSGGQDVNPLRYGEEPDLYLEKVHHIRDNFDFELLKMALKKNIPILGICRGHQLINVFFGGTLHQDIPTSIPNAIDHRQDQAYDFGTHTILVKKGSWLSKVLDNQNKVIVNSFHHQAVKDLAPGFMITAEAKDGVVEGIEKTDGGFCVGVQWHPEMMHERDPQMLKIIKSFIDECIKSQTNSKNQEKKKTN